MSRHDQNTGANTTLLSSRVPPLADRHQHARTHSQHEAVDRLQSQLQTTADNCRELGSAVFLVYGARVSPCVENALNCALKL